MEVFKNCLIVADGMSTRMQLRLHTYCYFPWLVIQKGESSSLQPKEKLVEDRTKVDTLLEKYGFSRNDYY